MLGNYADFNFGTLNVKLNFNGCKTDCNEGIVLKIIQKRFGGVSCNFRFAYLKFLENHFC